MIDKIYDLGVLPVIKIDDANDAKPLAKALIEGDLPAAEVTFRTAAAKDAIKNISSEYPDMILGAGTVLTTAQVDDAVGAGAQFIISPGLNPKVVEYCVNKKIPIFPGVNNPSQIEQAIELGLKVVKFFPAEPSGGLNMLKAMSAPYVNMKFMPTGGVNAANIVKYLDFNKIVACGGSWMVPENLLKAKDFAGITSLTKEAVMTVLGVKFLHLGVNNPNDAEAVKFNTALTEFFGIPQVRATTNAYFMGNDFEVMKHEKLGKHGHIGFTVNNVKRALAYLERKGVKAKHDDFYKTDDKGIPVFAYLDLELSGFAVHLKYKDL